MPALSRVWEFPDLLIELGFNVDPQSDYLRAAFTYNADGFAVRGVDSIAPYVLEAGDVLEFDLWWEDTAAYISVDVADAGGAWSMRENGAVDQNGYALAATTLIPDALVLGKWYARRAAVPVSGIGKTLVRFMVTSNPPGAGTKAARVRDVRITDGAGNVKRWIWRRRDLLPTFTTFSSAALTGTTLEKLTEEPTWADVSQYVKRWSTRRGRGHELDRVPTGTATIRLDNSDRRFEPEYAASPYYPNVIPYRQARISALWPPAIRGGAQTTYRVFRGFVERWVPERVGPTIAYTELECVDLFEALAAVDIEGTFPFEWSGLRIGRLLDLAGAPVAHRNLQNGKTAIDNRTYEGDALSELQTTTETEVGHLFVAKDGRVTFRDRHDRITLRSAVLGTFGDGAAQNPPIAGELPYRRVTPDFDVAKVKNDVAITRAATSEERRVADETSIGRYLPRTLSRTLPLQSATEAEDMARWLRARFKEPDRRIEGLELSPRMDDAVWVQVLDRELGDRLRVLERPAGGGVARDEQVHVESIAHDVEGTEWVTVFGSAPADPSGYWVLGSGAGGADDVNSRLDITTRLAY